MTLPVDKTLKQFIQKYLNNIETDEQNTTLYFSTNVDSQEIIELFQQIPGFMEIDRNSVLFHHDVGVIGNQDIGSIINGVNKCLQTESKDIVPISETYEKLLTNILSVGDLYSSFIELILSILYVGYDNNIIRYQIKKGLDIKITKKYSVKEAHNFLSPVLSLLYEPNTNSIKRYYNNLIQNNSHVISVYERIWLDLI